MKTIALCWALTLLWSGALSAQEDRLVRRLDPGTVAAVLALADSARALSLPTEPVVEKALEGASKGAGSDEIVAAARSLVQDLAAARDVLGPDVPGDALQLGAAALAAGATATELAPLRDHRGERGFQGALAGVVYLLSRGVAPGVSVRIVSSMLEAGLTGPEFTALQRLVEQDVRGGVPSTEAASVRARALIRHGPGVGPDPGGGG